MLQRLKSVNWRIFWILFAAGLLGVIAILPYMADLVGTISIEKGEVGEMPLPLIVILAILQNGLLLAVIIVIGMILSERVGLRMPLIRAWTTDESPPKPSAILLPGLLLGAAVGIVLVAVEAIFFLPRLPEAMHPFFEIPLWKRLLAGVLYGGLTEELFMRLFLLSLVAWLLGKRWKTPEGTPTTAAFSAAIVVVAILFGLGHLPSTAAFAPLTPLLVVRALVLNGIAGVAFGYLYWKNSLEAAMLGHMGAHLVMQIPGVMLLRGML